MDCNYRKALHDAKEAYKDERHHDALSILNSSLTPDAPFALLHRSAKWCAGVDWPVEGKMKVAFLGGATLDFLVDMICFWMLLKGVKLEVYVPYFGTWKQQLFDESSGLYEFEPDVVWFFNGWRDLEGIGVSRPEDVLRETAGYWSAVKDRFAGVAVIQNNADIPNERIFGNYGVMISHEPSSWCREYNLGLRKVAEEQQVIIFDIDHLSAEHGLRAWHDSRYWFHAKNPFAPDLAPSVGYDAAQVLCAVAGLSKKCIVLDLDNTLWGGVVGDDGLKGLRLGHGPDGEAFVAFQSYLKSLSKRGVILAVCSKNEEAAAREPFEKHPFMSLSLDDIAVFKANWRNKADNIREIAEVLNLGLDSFVFLDDNPAERALIRAELPMVAVPELPSDPAEFVPAIDKLRYFEMVAYSREDELRGRMYKENAVRREAKSQCTDLSVYLEGLEMVAEVGELDDFHVARMAQLVNKSNQFHPTTRRYTESELRDISNDPDCIVRWFSLKDRFGDNGLIAVLVLRKADECFVIDAWAMSCRVLSRGMEEFICMELVSIAQAAAARGLKGLYIPTKKNVMVADLYNRLGFECVRKDDDGTTEWMLDVDSYSPEDCYIRKIDQEK